MAVSPLLALREIRKAFAGHEVLHGVDFDLRPGEVHALVGENGAGKSTLIKVLAGAYRDYTGRIELRGHEVRFADPRDAERAGIAVIYQELALIPHLSVAENLLLGREPRTPFGQLAAGRIRAAARTVLADELGLALDVTRTVAELPIGVQQLVEIAKALARRAEILVMDEPTSALSEEDTQRLFAAVRRLRARGVAIIYISHKIDELYALADRITVLRDGRRVVTASSAELTCDQLVHHMVGRNVAIGPARRSAPPGIERLRAERIWVATPDRRRWLVQDASLRVRAGEILGLAGLLGSGASELLGALFGRIPLARGTVTVDGRPFPRPSPAAALRRGVALLTNDRQASGLVPPMSVLHNLSLATLAHDTRAGVLSHRAEQRRCLGLVDRLRLRMPSPASEVTALSGGNQQKVLLARWLLAAPRVLLLDEPTRGIDVAAKADIYHLLDQLTTAGLGILLITSELPELLALADRILVLHRGRIVAELDRECATQERILHAAMGGA